MNKHAQTIVYVSNIKSHPNSLNLAAVCVIQFCHASQICVTKEIKISKDSYGKPHCSVDGIFLSLSHCGAYLVCAVSTEPIGIDIEKKATLLHSPELASPPAVFDPVCWTKIESCSKILGKGLCISLDEILKYVNCGRFVFRECLIDPEHICTICQCDDCGNGSSPDIQQVVWLSEQVTDYCF